MEKELEILINRANQEIEKFHPLDLETQNEHDVLIGVKDIKMIVEKYIRMAATLHLKGL